MVPASAVDAVDLTSVAGGGNAVATTSNSGGMKRPSDCRFPPLFPHSLFGLSDFWANQRSSTNLVASMQHPVLLEQQAQPPVSLSNRRAAKVPRFCDLFHTEGVVGVFILVNVLNLTCQIDTILFFFNWKASSRGATAHVRICFHIMKDKVRGSKPVSVACNPWWYKEPSANVLKPKPRERAPTGHYYNHHHHHHHHHHQNNNQALTRMPCYEQYMRTTMGGGAGMVPPSPHPIAIDLTRSPPPHTGHEKATEQHQEASRSVDVPAVAAKFFQQQQKHQDTELMMALKRRRLMPESGSSGMPQSGHSQAQLHPQFFPPPHHQNGGGMRMPLSLPFPQAHFRHNPL